MFRGLPDRLNAGPLTTTCSLADHPFDLYREELYQRWREEKLAAVSPSSVVEPIEIADPRALTKSEIDKITTNCRVCNFCLYVFTKVSQTDPRKTVIAFARQLGLYHIDKPAHRDTHRVATITVNAEQQTEEYIPYTNRPINWHTDGYYNTQARQIRGVIMHCVQAASRGGANKLLDPELVYIKLRDIDSQLIEALMSSNALCIPANDKHPEMRRPARGGPVFSMDCYNAKLHMRYTHRTKSVSWAANQSTEKAARVLRDVIENLSEQASTVRLEPRQGILCNNVLHTREGFTDVTSGRSRTLLRARYFERIAGT